MRACLYLHRPSPPFAPIRELRSAINIDRVHSGDAPGLLSFDVAITEGLPFDGPLLTGTGLEDEAWLISTDQLHEGSVIVDRSTELLEPWAWYVSRISYDLEEGSAHVECQEWRQLLYERVVPPAVSGASLSAPQLAGQLLAAAGGRNPHHVHTSPGSLGSGHLLPPEPFALGAQSVGAALDSLAQRTNSEWWLDYHITWSSVQPILRWTSRRGRDLSGFAVLDGGYHLSSAAYTRALVDAASLVSFVGGSGEASDRPIASVAFGPLEATGRAPTGGQMEGAPVKDERAARTSLASKGAAARGEKVVVVPDEETSALMISSRRWSELRVQPIEALELTVRGNPLLAVHTAGSALEVYLWEHLRLGDRLSVRLQTAYLNEPINIPVRILALQPDEAEGELVMAVEVSR